MNLKKITMLIMAFVLIMICLTGCGGEFDAGNDITVISREDGSGTRGAFIELFGIEEKGDGGTKKDRTTKEAIIANKSDVMLTNVAGEEHAIGYVSLGALSHSVKALKIDGAEANAENVKNGSYKAVRTFNIATKGNVSPVAQDFINYILSAEGQAVVGESYIEAVDNAPSYSGTKPEGKIVVAGSSSVSPVMEKLKEAYISINPNVKIEIQTNDSTSGITAVIEETCDIGMVSRELKESEAAEGIVSTAIALDGIAVIVNPVNPLDELSAEQVKSIFTGNAVVWSDVE